MSQLTPNLQLVLPDISSPSWGQPLNSNWSILDTAVGNLQALYQGPWSSSVAYAKGQIVSRIANGVTAAYISLVPANYGNDPLATNQAWACISTPPGLNFRGAWTANTLYMRYDVVTYGGGSYVAEVGFTSGASFDATNLLELAAPGGPGSPGAPGIASLPQLAAVRVATLSPSRNMVPLAGWQPGYIDSTNGNYNTLNQWAATPLVLANSGGQMTASLDIPAAGPNGIAFYGADGATYVSGIQGDIPAGTPFNVPASAAYLRCASNNPSFQAQLVIVNGGAGNLPAAYEAPYTYSTTDVDAKVAALNTTMGTLLPKAALAALLASARGMIESPATLLNLYNWKDAVPGVLQTNGTINSQGGFGGNFYTTGFLFVYGQPEVVVNGSVFDNTGGGYPPLAYDVTGAIIGNVTVTAVTGGSQLTYPAGTVSIRFSMNQNLGTATGLVVVAGSTLPAGFVPFPANMTDSLGASVTANTNAISALFPFAGAPLHCFGDSISAFGKYQPIVAAGTRMTVGTQNVQAGRAMFDIFQDYYVNGAVNEAALQAALQATTNAGGIVLIALSTNDNDDLRNGSTPLGSITDAPAPNIGHASNSVSWYSYAGYALDTIYRLCPHANVLVVGAYHRDRSPTYPYNGSPIIVNYPYPTTDPYTDQLNTGLQQLAAKYSAHYVSWAARCGFNQYNVLTPQGNPDYTADGLHPSTPVGFQKISEPIIDAINHW